MAHMILRVAGYDQSGLKLAAYYEPDASSETTLANSADFEKL